MNQVIPYFIYRIGDGVEPASIVGSSRDYLISSIPQILLYKGKIIFNEEDNSLYTVDSTLAIVPLFTGPLLKAVGEHITILNAHPDGLHTSMLDLESHDDIGKASLVGSNEALVEAGSQDGVGTSKVHLVNGELRLYYNTIKFFDLFQNLIAGGVLTIVDPITGEVQFSQPRVLTTLRFSPISNGVSITVNLNEPTILHLVINKLTYTGKLNDNTGFGNFDFIYEYSGATTIITIYEELVGFSFQAGMVIDIIYS